MNMKAKKLPVLGVIMVGFLLRSPISHAQTTVVVPDAEQTDASLAATTTSGFGLAFEDLLGIVLTQLTYQDPLKPIDNFEFVSQLAQFSQIQQAENMNSNLEAILQSASVSQATDLLGRTIQLPAGSSEIEGVVTEISFLSGEPRLTIVSSDGFDYSNISLASISVVK